LGQNTNDYKRFVATHEARKPLGGPGSKLYDNIKIYLKIIWWARVVRVFFFSFSGWGPLGT
jgi:hypothetical protein